MTLVVDPFSTAADFLDPPSPEHADNQVAFIEKRLKATLWSKQEDIIRSVERNKRTAVPACFASSKSFTAANIAVAWIGSRPTGMRKVVSTAAVFRQVRAILWPEMHAAFARADPPLPGRMNKTEWHVPTGVSELLVAFGAATRDPTRLQGSHAPAGVLTIIDEADGVSQDIFDAAEGLMVGPYDRLLAVGNPWDPTSAFAAACKPGSGFNVIRIAAKDTPNLSGEAVPEWLARSLISEEWVKDRARIWGANDPRYISKVDARWPESVRGTLVHLIWLEEAQKRRFRNSLPIELAVDVGGDTGGDETVVGLRRGKRYRTYDSTRSMDTMEISGLIIRALEDTGASVVRVDAIGIGKGVYDRLRELNKPVVPIIASQQASDPETFENLRAEMGWGIRERFEAGDIDVDPEDEELASESTRIRYKLSSRGRIILESKDSMRQRGLPSPDHFDTMAMCFAPIGVGEFRTETTKEAREAARNRRGPLEDDLMDEDAVGF